MRITPQPVLVNEIPNTPVSGMMNVEPRTTNGSAKRISRTPAATMPMLWLRGAVPVPCGANEPSRGLSRQARTRTHVPEKM